MSHLYSDPRGRAIPTVLEWVLTECDINKDVTVSDAFHMASLHIQEKMRVWDFELILNMYFKVRGPDTIWRTELRITPLMSITAFFGLHDYKSKPNVNPHVTRKNYEYHRQKSCYKTDKNQVDLERIALQKEKFKLRCLRINLPHNSWIC